MPLPRAYRSLPRPSSPPCAQAFPTCLRSLDYRICSKQSTRASFFTNFTNCDEIVVVVMIHFPRSTPTSIVKQRRRWPLPENSPGAARQTAGNRCERGLCRGVRQIVRTFSSTPDSARAYSLLRKGGDPAAGSPTATLLRLRPSHSARLRRLGLLRVPTPTSGAPSFHGVTGGVYKARERIHRRMADRRLLAIPASCRRVAACNPN